MQHSSLRSGLLPLPARRRFASPLTSAFFAQPTQIWPGGEVVAVEMSRAELGLSDFDQVRRRKLPGFFPPSLWACGAGAMGKCGF